jgi:hypothetical protein
MGGNFDKLTDMASGALGKFEKWAKATDSVQNGIIFDTALADAGVGAITGAIGGLFTDQGIVGGAMQGAVLGAGAGALMKRSQVLATNDKQANVNRMTKARSNISKHNSALTEKEKVISEMREASIEPRWQKANWLRGNRLKDAPDPALDKKLALNRKQQKAILEADKKLTSTIEAEQQAIKYAMSSAPTGGGALGALGGMAFATLDSNRV